MNKRWQDAWHLVRSDLVRFKLGVGLTLVFMVYNAVGSLWALAVMSNADSGFLYTYMKTLIDFMMFISVSSLGYMFNRRSFRYMANDSYRKHLIKLRTLPVDTQTIVLSRYISLGLNTLVNGLIFFGIQYLFINNVVEPLAFDRFAIYALTFTAYSVVMHTVYIQFEWRYSGKKYFYMVSMIMLVSLIVAIIIGLTGNSIFLTVMDLTLHWPVLTFIIAVTVIIQTFQIGMKLSLRTLRKVDLM